MDYLIIKTPLFYEKFYKIILLNKRSNTENRIANLRTNPYVGKPLGYKYLRELKLDKFRIYYVIFENEITVLLIDVGDKKNQRNNIEFIKKHRGMFKEMIKNLNNG